MSLRTQKSLKSISKMFKFHFTILKTISSLTKFVFRGLQDPTFVIYVIKSNFIGDNGHDLEHSLESLHRIHVNNAKPFDLVIFFIQCLVFISQKRANEISHPKQIDFNRLYLINFNNFNRLQYWTSKMVKWAYLAKNKPTLQFWKSNILDLEIFRKY